MNADRYMGVISLIERLHRHFLELIKLELDAIRLHDINNVQALMLFNINDGEMTIGELTARGYYLGSNVSYNVKKMVQNGYIDAERSAHDLRSVQIKLTKKGRSLRDRLNAMHDHHIGMLGESGITEGDLKAVIPVLQRLERFWIEASHPYGHRV